MIPQHIAIVMDGNRRWAKERVMMTIEGHKYGAEALKSTILKAKEYGIQQLTAYTLSTENLQKRDNNELNALWDLILYSVENDISYAHNNKIRFKVIGDMSQLPHNIQAALSDLEASTLHYTDFIFTTAINYGGRDELLRAYKRLMKAGITDVTEDIMNDYLDTQGLLPIDLCIRTGGHHRLSNFLLWQLAYTELYFTDTYWPAFDDNELKKALDWYSSQQRNHGK